MPAPSPITAAPAYHRHRPEQTIPYAIVAEHYPRFVRAIEQSGGHLPRFVRQEFEDYLKCGLLEHGFLRVKCDGSCHEHLVAFSCKRRGFCPSCGARRMVESAAHLVDHVFPEAPVRHRHRDLSACGGKLRVIAVSEDPPLIAKIPGHVQQRAALIARSARGPPPDSMSVPQLT